MQFELEEGVQYGGSNIEQCGVYNSRAEIQNQCEAKGACVGYSMVLNKNKDSEAENNKYAWCMKSSEDSIIYDSTHDYYRKIHIGTFEV